MLYVGCCLRITSDGGSGGPWTGVKMLNNDELGRAYGLGYYSKEKHDIIAGTYLAGRESFYYRSDPSTKTTRREAFQAHLRGVHRKVERNDRKIRRKEVFVDDLGELADSQDESYFEVVAADAFSEKLHYPWRAENILNKLLALQIKTLVDGLLSNFEKKTRQMLLMYYGEDLTFEEIGKRFKCSKSTAERKIKRAMSQLRAIVQRKGLEYKDLTRFEPQFIYRKPSRDNNYKSITDEEGNTES